MNRIAENSAEDAEVKLEIVDIFMICRVVFGTLPLADAGSVSGASPAEALRLRGNLRI